MVIIDFEPQSKGACSYQQKVKIPTCKEKNAWDLTTREKCSKSNYKTFTSRTSVSFIF